MLSGAASVEALVPGSPAVVAAALENVGAGVGAARDVGAAWRMLQIPSWQGRGAVAWSSFTPGEASRVGRAPAAFGRVAAALLRYESAFQTARAEARAAINDAAAAERVSAQAAREHEQAVKDAALADPGTPAAVLPVFTDPGAAALAGAHDRLARARTALASAGDEVAAEIRAAAGGASGAGAGFLPGPVTVPTLPDMRRGFEFVKGIGVEALDDVLFLLQISNPVGQFQLFMEDFEWIGDGPEGWFRHDAEVRRMWSDGTLLEAFKNAFLAADKWDDNPPEAAGRASYNIASLAIPLGGIAIKLGKTAKAAAAARKALRQMTSLLKNSKGVTITGGRVHVDGVDKMSLKELTDLYEQSIHNMDAKQATLGKWIEDSPKSYERVAQDAGDAHFNLKDPGWENARNAYRLTNNDLYELLNKPFLEQIIEKKVPVRFTDDPTLRPGSALNKELKYLELHNYEYDPRTGLATYQGK